MKFSVNLLLIFITIFIVTTSCLPFENDFVRDAEKDPESINFIPNSPSSYSIRLEDWGVRILWSNRSNFEDGFIVERSVDSSPFRMIARLPTNYTRQEDGSLERISPYGYSDEHTNLIYSSTHIKYRVKSYAVRDGKMNINPNYAEFWIDIY